MCICGAEPELKNVLECSMSRWQVVCECGRISDTFIYPKNAEWNWDLQNPVTEVDTKSQKLLHEIQGKVHAQRLLNTDFGESADELLGNYIITDKGELALENQKNSDKATYWFEKHNEAQEELDDLRIEFNYMKADRDGFQTEAIELREEVKYWTNAYNEQVQARDKDVITLMAIKNLVEGK